MAPRLDQIFPPARKSNTSSHRVSAHRRSVFRNATRTTTKLVKPYNEPIQRVKQHSITHNYQQPLYISRAATKRLQLAPRHVNTKTRRRLQKKRQQRPHHQNPTHFLPQLHKTRNVGRVANTGGRREQLHLSRTKDVSETGSSTPKLPTSAQPERVTSRRQRSRCTSQQRVQFATPAILDLERQL